MTTLVSFIAALVLSLSLLIVPIGWIAWVAAVCWSVAIYGLHHALTEQDGLASATATCLIVGALASLMLGAGMQSVLIGHMGASAVGSALLMRGIYTLLADRFLSIE